MLESVFQIGIKDNDNNETIEIKHITCVIGILMSLGGLVWGSILVYYKMYFPAIIPFGYVVVTLLNLTLLAVSKEIIIPRFIQLFFSILLPFALQWMLGGFISSGGMMLWSILGLVGSLVLHKGRNVYLWLIPYGILLIITLLTNNIAVAHKPTALTEDIYPYLLMLNISIISLIVFIIGKIKVDEDLIIRLEVEAKNIEISNKVDQLKALTKQLTASNDDLRKFSHVVSHDLKSPLRAISNLANIVIMDNKESLNKESIEHLNTIINRIKHLYNLIEGILSYSKIKHGEAVAVQSKINTNELVSSIIELITKPSNIKINITRPLPDVMYNKFMLHQVFQNLISNAVNHMDKLYGNINIDYYLKDNKVVFHITDNGPGIDRKYHNKIFQIFQILKQSTSKESTGIGLSICKKIIELNHGKIWLKSSLGEGTTFYFTISS